MLVEQKHVNPHAYQGVLLAFHLNLLLVLHQHRLFLRVRMIKEYLILYTALLKIDINLSIRCNQCYSSQRLPDFHCLTQN